MGGAPAVVSVTAQARSSRQAGADEVPSVAWVPCCCGPESGVRDGQSVQATLGAQQQRLALLLEHPPNQFGESGCITT